MKRAFWTVLGLAALVYAGGCSPYIDGFYYSPRPAVAQLPPTTQPGTPPVSAEATVIGVRYADDSAKLPETIEVRLQVNNNSNENVTLDPQSLMLSNVELINFAGAIVEPPQPINLVQNQSAVLDILFPFPPGRNYENTDLESLQMRWTVSVGGQPMGMSVGFNRAYARYYYYDYYDPYWGGPYWGYPHPVYYGGVVIIHRR